MRVCRAMCILVKENDKVGKSGKLTTILELIAFSWAVACFFHFYKVHGFAGLIQAVISKL